MLHVNTFLEMQIRQHLHSCAFTRSHLKKSALCLQPKGRGGDQSALWETLFCCKRSRTALRRHRGALLMSPARSMPTQHWFCVSSHPRLLPPVPPFSPTFPFISHFPLHFHANFGGEKSSCHVIYSDAAGLSIHTKGWGLRGLLFASPSSKHPLLDEKHDTYMVRLLGIMLIKTSVELSTQRDTQCQVEKQTTARFTASYFSQFVSVFCRDFMLLQSSTVVFSRGSASNFCRIPVGNDSQPL